MEKERRTTSSSARCTPRNTLSRIEVSNQAAGTQSLWEKTTIMAVKVRKRYSEIICCLRA